MQGYLVYPGVAWRRCCINW